MTAVCKVDYSGVTDLGYYRVDITYEDGVIDTLYFNEVPSEDEAKKASEFRLAMRRRSYTPDEQLKRGYRK